MIKEQEAWVKKWGNSGGTFVMPKSVADGIILEANGSVSKLEQLLSLGPRVLGDSPVRLDIAAPQGLRMPSGNELGAIYINPNI